MESSDGFQVELCGHASRRTTGVGRRLMSFRFLRYDVLGSAFAHSQPSKYPPCSSVIVGSSLHYAEANNYLTFPAVLLQTVLAAAKLLQRFQDGSQERLIKCSEEQEMLSLLRTAQSFNVRGWASII